MNRFSLYRWIVYCLLALLPLQAFAAAPLALCAEKPFSEIAEDGMHGIAAADHCARMAAAAAATDAKPHGADMCWLGSVCLASGGSVAVPVTYQLTPIKQDSTAPTSITTLYLSIVPDAPQRPPISL